MSNNKTATELLPCPFCGAKAEIRSDGKREWALVSHWENCLFPTFRAHEISASDFEAWNTRAPETCRVEGAIRYDYEGGYGGTEYEHALSCGHKVTWSNDDAPDFCPWCGRKVVDDD